jgi:GntR family transcriptional regulator
MMKIDPSSYIPFYEQIKAQIKHLISIGDLGPRDSLPSIRDLATRLIVNPNTVARAYRELEIEGFIYTRKGKGCFVSDDSSVVLEKEKQSILSRLFDSAIEEASKFNLDSDEIKRLFEKRINRAREIKEGGNKNG